MTRKCPRDAQPTAKDPIKGKVKTSATNVTDSSFPKPRKRNRKRNRRKPRTPNTHVMILTAREGEMAAAMRKARESIKLQDLGITSLKPRRALNGDLKLEISGKEGAEQAKNLAVKMRDALSSMEGVKITNPTKASEVRIRDLMDGTSKLEVAEAIAASIEGGDPASVQMGEIKFSPNGLGMVWAKCPTAMAIRATATGRISVGWVRARVELLDARPTHCYKCLNKGHVAAYCRSNIDRSGCCYRCGGEGHKVAECSNQPKCPICTEAKLPNGHRLGGPKCRTPRKAGSWVKIGKEVDSGPLTTTKTQTLTGTGSQMGSIGSGPTPPSEGTALTRPTTRAASTVSLPAYLEAEEAKERGGVTTPSPSPSMKRKLSSSPPPGRRERVQRRIVARAKKRG